MYSKCYLHRNFIKIVCYMNVLERIWLHSRRLVIFSMKCSKAYVLNNNISSILPDLLNTFPILKGRIARPINKTFNCVNLKKKHQWMVKDFCLHPEVWRNGVFPQTFLWRNDISLVQWKYHLFTQKFVEMPFPW